MSNSHPKKIRLGICMAGAVSAGAYTAGVIDYLIETLERWEQKKKEIAAKEKSGQSLTPEETLVPRHDVVVEVLSGASAGGMTAAILAYSFNDGSYINRRQKEIINANYDKPIDTDTPSKLYDCWINMVDEKGNENGTTFCKLMDPSDVVPIAEMKAILNSKPIDDIALKAIPERINFNPPAYISPHLSVILSVTNLEGVPIDIRFSNINSKNPTRNVLHMHSGFLHYQFNEQPIAIDFPAELVNESTKDHLAAAAKATGAFPFGLANRKIIVKKEHFDDFKSRLSQNYHLEVNLDLGESQTYVFNAVDGGTINNEPIGTTVKILNSKKASNKSEEENYVILIDPFPTVHNASKEVKYEEPKEYTLKEQFFKIIGAIRNQSMFKQEDLLNALDMDCNRFLIYPAKRKYYYLASGELDGFGGFLKKEFREHDYQLGRKNCQAFLRYYFGETPDRFADITGKALSPQQIDKWAYNANYGMEDKAPELRIPLIPDMLQLADDSPEINTPRYDGLTVKELNVISAQIRKRLEKVVDKSYPLIADAGKSIHWTAGLATKLFKGMFKRKITGSLSKKMDDYLQEVFNPQTFKQDYLVTKYADIIERYGKLYQKTSDVTARVAEGGERIISIIKGKKETENIASKGDYIVTNPGGEEFIVKPEEFAKRYVHVSGNRYRPTEGARVYALQITGEAITRYGLEGAEKLITDPDKPLNIEAAWNESQKLYINDYLVCPVHKNEVYRIERTVFTDTYTEGSLSR